MLVLLTGKICSVNKENVKKKYEVTGFQTTEYAFSRKFPTLRKNDRNPRLPLF